MNTLEDAAATYKLLAGGLEKYGYTMELRTDSEWAVATFTAPGRRAWTTPISHIHYPFTQPTAKEISINKAKAYAYASERGIPTPYTHSLSMDEAFDHHHAEELFNTHRHLIVKPNNSSLSKGLTLNITNASDLERAIETARVIKQEDILIQEQVDGEEIRFIVMKGKVQAALLRESAQVIGDGVHSVKELLEIENSIRKDLSFPYIQYPILTDAIISPSYFVNEQILEQGEVLRLNRATMIRNGCSVYNVLEQVNPTYIKAVETLAEGVETDFLAVDFLLEDYKSTADEHGYWFLEFNTSPVLKLCYGCRDGKMFDVVSHLSQLIDRALQA